MHKLKNLHKHTHTDIYEYAEPTSSLAGLRNVLLFFLINSQCHTALQPRHLFEALTVTEVPPLFLAAGLCPFLMFAVYNHVIFFGFTV